MRSHIFNLRSALKLLSLVALVAGITRINFTSVITSAKYSCCSEDRDGKYSTIDFRLIVSSFKADHIRVNCVPKASTDA